MLRRRLPRHETVTDLVENVVDLVGVLEKSPAVRIEIQPPADSVEEASSQFLFQGGKALAESGLGNMKRPGCFCQALGFCYFLKIE